MTLAQAYKNLSSKGFIKPLDPTPMPNPIPPTWNLNDYYHFHQKFGHKTDNCFRLKHERQDHIDNGTLINPNIITKEYEIEWDCSKLIETMEVNTVEVQGIWYEEDKILKSAVAVWGILPKGMAKIKKGVIKDNMPNITRSGKHYKPSFLEKDHPGKDIEEGSKPMDPKDKEKEDQVLTQLKKT